MAELVIPKNSLHQSVKFQEISDKVLARLKTIPEIDSQKHSLELVEFICNLIEALVKKKHKLNKENLLLYTLKRATDLNEDDIALIKEAIQYLHENKLIKKISNFSYIGSYIKKAIKSRIL